MGKWSKESVAEQSEELAPMTEFYQKLDNNALSQYYADWRKNKEAAEKDLKHANLEIRAMEMIFAERFAENDVQTMKFNNGMTLTITVEQGFVFKDKEKFIRFLEDEGWHHELTVPAGSLNRLMRDLAEKKLSPPGVELGEPFTKFSCRGLK